MDKKTFTEIVKKLKEVDKVIKSLDPAIREGSFKLLYGYITAGKPAVPVVTKIQIDNDNDDDFKTNFFTKFNHDKPSDNILMITAYHYSQYGIDSISMNEIKEIADDVGVTIPGRPDMTIKAAKRDGKSLFKSGGRSKYKPTVHGEKFFKETYEVCKGKKKKDEDN